MQNYTSGNTKPLIKVVPFQPHCFAFGGFELQMIGAMQAARDAGACISPLDMWDRSNNFDIVHLWGFWVSHHPLAKWAYLDGKKIVMSALLAYPSILTALRNQASRVIGSSRLKFEMLPWLSALTVVSEGHAEYAKAVLGIDSKKIFVIPNIVEDIFYNPPTNSPKLDIDFNDYVICTGNICRRKNQLMLARACKKLDIPLLLIGGLMPGEYDYGAAVSEVINSSKRMRWIPEVPSASLELAAAYKNSLLFALPSHSEAQPISALEAGAVGKPVLLGNKQYAKQRVYKNACLVTTSSEDSLVFGLRKVMDSPLDYRPPKDALESCRRNSVGSAYKAIYCLDSDTSSRVANS
jgi:glycosyltransferase involved in cell wall biosynthesis